MRRAFVALVTLALAAPLAEAQIRVPARSTDPVIWGSLSAGFLQFSNDIRDGNTQSIWRFASSIQYRGTAEFDVGNSGAVGMAVGYSDVPMTYYTATDITGCFQQCDGHAKVWTVMGTFHMGGGIGFHQIIDLSAGTTIYRDFRVDDSDARIGPQSPDKDLSLSVGYGFGWGFSNRLQIMLVQDAVYTMHQRDGLSGSQNSNSQQFTTRLGARFGLGSKRR